MSARYTVLLKDLLADEVTAHKINDALSTYPLYQKQSKEEYIPSIVPTREELNKKILNHYKYYEIGFESPGRFIEELEISMNEIMPRYNQLLFSADQDFNVLYNVDYQRTISENKDAEGISSTVGTDSTTTNISTSNEASGSTSDQSSTNSTVNHTAKSVESQTPQGQIGITAANIDSVSYADKVNWNKDTNSDTATTSGTGTTSNTSETLEENTTTGSNNIDNTSTTKEKNETLETTKGNFGVVSSQDLILKYRELILNIEQMIINDERISELFMLVF